ncbi:MAG: hypothetical protein M9916_02000 [Crocinitomicaceae bacterium]|jgi:hypothetical protein|nr:hypothetical protein [Crocinitomicaceae bacterium]
MNSITTYYRSKDGATIVEYVNGAFHSWTNIRADKISIEALRHDIAMFEEELDLELFEKVPLNSIKFNILNS